MSATNLVKMPEVLTDAEKAARYRSELVATLAPLMKVMAEAKADGFRVGWAIGVDYAGLPCITQIDIMRAF